MTLISLIIPSYNESKNLFKLCNKLDSILKKDKTIEVILVNNGSTDETIKILKTHKIYNRNNFIIKNIKRNIGYGHGILTGVNSSKGKILAWFHADLQINPNQVLKAIKLHKMKLLKQNILVKGVRKNRNIFDYFFTFCMSKIVNLIFKTSISDINAQPKIFNKKILNNFKNPPKDFSLDLYILLIACYNNYKIVNYPIYWGERYSGEAKGGGNLVGKRKLTIRYLLFIKELKKKWK